MLTFRKNYFYFTVLLFVVEVLIALYVHDHFVRPYVGDFLVVILIYCLLRTFLKASVKLLASATLAFATGIEILQFLNIVELLGLQHNIVARTVIGTSFSWHDLLCYLAGIAFVLLIERLISVKSKS